jgi:hypothetical protein
MPQRGVACISVGASGKFAVEFCQQQPVGLEAQFSADSVAVCVAAAKSNVIEPRNRHGADRAGYITTTLVPTFTRL